MLATELNARDIIGVSRHRRKGGREGETGKTLRFEPIVQARTITAGSKTTSRSRSSVESLAGVCVAVIAPIGYTTLRDARRVVGYRASRTALSTT